MFHVLLALPAIAVFGTVAGTVLSVLSGLLVLAFIAELLFGFVFRMAKWLLWLPCVLGMAVLGILRVYVFASGTERDRAGSSDYRHF